MHKSLHHIMHACRYSWDGLRAVWQDEIAFRQIILLVVIGMPSAVWWARTWAECILLILPIVLCIIVELLNTAIENTIDRISPELHPLSKKAKDMGSAAQLIAQLFLATVWVSYCVSHSFF